MEIILFLHGPYYQEDVNILESVQCGATKIDLDQPLLD